MERDNLKKYIQQHRAEFDDLPVPANMLIGISDKINRRKSRRRKSMYYWTAAACTTALLIFSYQYLFHQPVKKRISHVVSVQNVKVAPSPIIATPAPAKETTLHTTIQTKKLRTKKITHPYKNILAGLRDSSSVARRIDAVFALNDMTSLNQKLKIVLCNTFANDESSNVRLAALKVLLKYNSDSLVQKHLISGLSTQKDPFIQMELVQMAEKNLTPECTKRLMELTDNPFTLSVVKEQAYYALLIR